MKRSNRLAAAPAELELRALLLSEPIRRYIRDTLRIRRAWFLLRLEDGGKQCRQAETSLANLAQRHLGGIGLIIGLKRHFGGAL